MGRDISIVAKHEACIKPTVRFIVDADTKLSGSTQIKFDLKPNKVFLFNKETEERLYEE